MTLRFRRIKTVSKILIDKGLQRIDESVKTANKGPKVQADSALSC